MTVSKVIEPGSLRHRIEIQSKNAQPDGCGGYNENWQILSETWASITVLDHGADQHYGNSNTTIRYRMTIRSGLPVTAEMRVLERERKFTVEHVYDPDQTGRYLSLVCAKS